MRARIDLRVFNLVLRRQMSSSPRSTVNVNHYTREGYLCMPSRAYSPARTRQSPARTATPRRPLPRSRCLGRMTTSAGGTCPSSPHRGQSCGSLGPRWSRLPTAAGRWRRSPAVRPARSFRPGAHNPESTSARCTGPPSPPPANPGPSRPRPAERSEFGVRRRHPRRIRLTGGFFVDHFPCAHMRNNVREMECLLIDSVCARDQSPKVTHFIWHGPKSFYLFY